MGLQQFIKKKACKELYHIYIGKGDRSSCERKRDRGEHGKCERNRHHLHCLLKGDKRREQRGTRMKILGNKGRIFPDLNNRASRVVLEKLELFGKVLQC
jgi:hypothetical protein